MLSVPFEDSRLELISPNRDTVSIFALIGLVKCDLNQRIKVEQPLRVSNYNSSTWNFRKNTFYASLKNPIDAMNEEFDRGLKSALPVGINYCENVLEVGRSFKAFGLGAMKKCERHASIVIGRRRDPQTGSCQFLIRNSWGSQRSSQYHSNWESVPGMGELWVDQESVGQALTSFQLIQH